jgi:hypothetical protein
VYCIPTPLSSITSFGDANEATGSEDGVAGLQCVYKTEKKEEKSENDKKRERGREREKKERGKSRLGLHVSMTVASLHQTTTEETENCK